MRTEEREKPTPDLCSPARTREVLRRHGFTIRKKYGQNFLIDAHVLAEIVEAAQLTEDDLVLEIGPGIGTLTQALACAAGEVVAVEIDRKLIPILGETLAGYDNVTVLCEDILKVDLSALSQEHGGRPMQVAANLPYYITTPVILKLLESPAPLAGITVMVQREVGERMKAGPGSKDYGSLSLAVQYYAEPTIAARVPSGCFLPQPSVDSVVLSLKCREKPPVRVTDEAFLFRLIRAAFGQRRKTLENSLAHAPGLNVTKEQVREALSALGLSPAVRGEALSLEEFAALANRMKRIEK